MAQANNDCRFRISIFDMFPTPATFACWKIRCKTEVCTCSQFPTVAMQWIKEVELVDSVDDFKFSSSTRGIRMPNNEGLDARLQHWTESSLILTSKEASVWRNRRPGSRTVSFAEDRLVTWSTSISGHWNSWFCREVCRLVYYWSSKWRYSGIRFLVGWNLTNPWRKSQPHDDILEGLYKLRIRELEKLKTLELYDLEIHQRKGWLEYHRLKTMVKWNVEQDARNKFWDRNENFEKNAVVKN